MKKEGYWIEELESGIFQSVFPPEQAELSALHSTVEDAKLYIEGCAGPVRIQIRRLKNDHA